MARQDIGTRMALPLLGVLLALAVIIAVTEFQSSSALAAHSAELPSPEPVAVPANVGGLSASELNQPTNPNHTYYNSRVVCGWETRTMTITIIGEDGQPLTITVNYHVWICKRVWYPVPHTHDIDVQPD